MNFNLQNKHDQEFALEIIGHVANFPQVLKYATRYLKCPNTKELIQQCLAPEYYVCWLDEDGNYNEKYHYQGISSLPDNQQDVAHFVGCVTQSVLQVLQGKLHWFYYKPNEPSSLYEWTKDHQEEFVKAFRNLWEKDKRNDLPHNRIKRKKF